MSVNLYSKSHCCNCLPYSEELQEDLLKAPPPSDRLPENFLGDAILPFLRHEEIACCQSVCKEWKEDLDQAPIWRTQCQKVGIPLAESSKKAFVNWVMRQYLGTLDDVPPVPEVLLKDMKSPSPFWDGKTVEETERLVLVPNRGSIPGLVRQPTTVCGFTMIPGRSAARQIERLTLNTLERVMQSKGAAGYRFVCRHVKAGLGDQPINPEDKAYWARVTKNIIPNSVGLSGDDHEQRVVGAGYAMPRGGEMIAVYFMDQTFLPDGEDDAGTLSRCEERVGDLSLAVGCSNESGLTIGAHDLRPHDLVGVVAVKRVIP
ncbi:MAG: hypothetical protein WCF19_00095 [Chlamydiales bacterium]